MAEECGLPSALAMRLSLIPPAQSHLKGAAPPSTPRGELGEGGEGAEQAHIAWSREGVGGGGLFGAERSLALLTAWRWLPPGAGDVGGWGRRRPRRSSGYRDRRGLMANPPGADERGRTAYVLGSPSPEAMRAAPSAWHVRTGLRPMYNWRSGCVFLA